MKYSSLLALPLLLCAGGSAATHAKDAEQTAASQVVEHLRSQRRHFGRGRSAELESRAECADYRSTGYSRGADQEWCSQCRETVTGGELRWNFYALAGGARACKLEQVEFQVAEPARTGRAALERELTAALGQPRTVDGSPEWHSGTTTYRLEEGSGETPDLRLVARSEALVRNMASYLVDLVEVDHYYRSSQVDVDAHLRAFDALAPDYPDIKSVIDWSQAEPLVHELHAALSHTRNREKRALLLFGIHSLSAAFGPDHRSYKTLWKAIERDEGTQWGGEAYLMLQRDGFSDSGRCNDDDRPEMFLQVIERGEKFLRDHPRSAVRLEVEFSVAMAYEAWWSLANGDDEDEPEAHADGAEQARERAVALYRHVLRDIKKRDARDRRIGYIERRLPRLSLGYATTQRAFVCGGC